MDGEIAVNCVRRGSRQQTVKHTGKKEKKKWDTRNSSGHETEQAVWKDDFASPHDLRQGIFL